MYFFIVVRMGRWFPWNEEKERDSISALRFSSPTRLSRKAGEEEGKKTG